MLLAVGVVLMAVALVLQAAVLMVSAVCQAPLEVGLVLRFVGPVMARLLLCASCMRGVSAVVPFFSWKASARQGGALVPFLNHSRI